MQASLVAQMVKNLPEIWETWVWSLGQKDPLKKGMAGGAVVERTCLPVQETQELWVLSWARKIPLDCSPSGSSVHGILQTRILQWVVIPFFRGSF